MGCKCFPDTRFAQQAQDERLHDPRSCNAMKRLGLSCHSVDQKAAAPNFESVEACSTHKKAQVAVIAINDSISAKMVSSVFEGAFIGAL